MKHHNFKGSEGSPNLRTEPRTSRTLGLSSKTEPRTYRTPQNGRTSNLEPGSFQVYLGIYHYFIAGHYYYVSIIFHGDLVILTVAQKRLVFDKQIADFYISTQLTNTILKLKLNFIF